MKSCCCCFDRKRKGREGGRRRGSDGSNNKAQTHMMTDLGQLIRTHTRPHRHTHRQPHALALNAQPKHRALRHLHFSDRQTRQPLPATHAHTPFIRSRPSLRSSVTFPNLHHPAACTVFSLQMARGRVTMTRPSPIPPDSSLSLPPSLSLSPPTPGLVYGRASTCAHPQHT